MAVFAGGCFAFWVLERFSIMKNVLAVLKRDFIRLVKAPAALVVVVALLILPSLYTWY